MAELNEFLKQYPGAAIIVNFSVVNDNHSELLKAYYYKYVIPTMRRAIWESGERFNDEQTAEFIKQNSPILAVSRWNSQRGYSTEYYNPEELDNAQFCEHIEWLKQWAAENYSVIIEDPKKQ